MSHSYLAYIDESGDDGMVKFREPGPRNGGASKWLCVSACLVRASRRLDTVAWRDQIRTTIASRREIHFAELNHAQRRATCQVLSKQPVRFISAIGNKTQLDPIIFSEKNSLYFYLTRHLVERISWFCRDERRMVPEGDGRVKIMFSRRGGLSYDGFKDYLRKLKSEHESSIHWPVIDIDGISAMDHSRDAGLQLADIGASAVAAALEPDRFGNVEPQYLHALQRRFYCRHGNYLSYGLKLLPAEVSLNRQQLAAIEPFKKNGQPPGP